MLRRYVIARFAPKHSPEKEQRLLSFAEQKAKHEFIDGMNEENGESITNEEVRKNIEKITEEIQSKLAFLNSLAGVHFKNDPKVDNTILNTFFTQHHDFVKKHLAKERIEFTYGDWTKETVRELTSEFMSEIQEIVRRNLEKMGPQSCAYISHDSFVREYMRSMGEVDLSAEACSNFSKSQRIPNAYFDKKNQKIFFDLSAPQFNYENQLKLMGYDSIEEAPEDAKMTALERVENNRQRAVVHELAHYSLDYINKYETIPLGERIVVRLKELFGVKSLNDYDQWKVTSRAVCKAFATDGTGWTHEEILHEGLAMLVANNRIPEKNETPAREAAREMRKLLSETKGDSHMKELLNRFNSDLEYLIVGDGGNQSAYDDAMKKMDMTAEEIDDNKLFKEQYEKNNVDKDVRNVRTKDPDIDKDIEQEIDKKAAKIAIDPSQVLKAINEATVAFESIKTIAPEYIKLLPAEVQKVQRIGFEKMVESLSKDMNDLGAVEKDTKIFEVWNSHPSTLSRDEKNRLAEKYKFANLGEYSAGMSASAEILLDEANKKKRGEVITELATAVSAHFTPTTKLAETLKEALEKKKQGEETSKDTAKIGILGRMNNLLGKKAGIHWLSVFDMIKIYNIYKDAILERYQSKQKIRIYDAAKDWNFYSPLQPDLDKQAKSANDEETSKFKEYLVKDGFTYDELFNNGGVLDKNRNNINRAKAVIDYAADHAWLYMLNRDDGSNVYGLDYEGLWGKRTFEELVDTNSKAQESEKSKGRSKVNNDPDIPLLVKEIKQELEKKNIWSVLGIVERLQEKAKYAESNTWALVAIIKTLQNDKNGTLRQVFATGGKGFMDAVGGLGIGQSAWSLTAFKIQRHALSAWIKEGCTEEAARKIGAKFAKDKHFPEHAFIPEVVNHIEKELYNNPENMDDVGNDGVWRNIAKVLSTQVIEGESGKSVSIFDDDPIFSGYRKYWHANQTTTFAKNTDDDFFNPGNDGSDIVLLWDDGIGSILECTSLGQFTHQPKARGYLTQLIVLHDKLKTENEGAYKNFREETKLKLKKWFVKSGNNTATRKTFGVYDTTTLPNDPTHSDKNILLELWKRDLVDDDMFNVYVDGFEKEETVPDIYKPLRKAISIEKAVKDKTPKEKQEAKAATQLILETLKKAK